MQRPNVRSGVVATTPLPSMTTDTEPPSSRQRIHEHATVPPATRTDSVRRHHPSGESCPNTRAFASAATTSIGAGSTVVPDVTAGASTFDHDDAFLARSLRCTAAVPPAAAACAPRCGRGWYGACFRASSFRALIGSWPQEFGNDRPAAPRCPWPNRRQGQPLEHQCHRLASHRRQPACQPARRMSVWTVRHSASHSMARLPPARQKPLMSAG